MSQAGIGDKGGNKNTSPKSQTGIVFLLIFIFLAVVIILAGSIFYRSSRSHFQSEAEKQLTVITALKVADLINWRQERLADGAIFYKNENFSARVRRAFAAPEDMDAQEKLSTWPRQFQKIFKYERIILLDANGVERLTFPATPEPVCSTLIRQAPEIMRSGQVVFLDLHRDAPGHPIHLAVAVPILDEKNFHLPLGLLVLKIDPATYLYPFIQRWPLPSRTAETLLVRRDGNDALFLNELKFQKNTALNLRIPLNQTTMPAVRAALGQEGIEEGKDYRGVPVLAVMRSIPGSPWSLVARMDKAEVFAPLADRLRLTIILIVVLLLGAGTGLALIRRRQQARFFRDKYKATEALRESEERFHILFESSQDSIMTLEPPNWNFTSGNPATVALFRAKNAQEFISCGPGNLSPERQPDGRASAEKAKEMIETAMREGSHFFEWTHMRTDGEEFPATVLLTRMEQAGKKFLQATVRDISERKRADSQREAALQELNESKALTNVVVENVPLMIFLKEATDLRFVIFNRAGEELLGYDRENLLGKNNLDLFPPEQAAHFMAKDREVLDGEVGMLDIPEESILTAKQGTRLLHTRKICVRGADGTTKYLLGISEDITEQKRVETQREAALKALGESEERFRVLSASAQDAILMMDDQGRLTYWNLSAERIFGYAGSEVLGRNLHDLIAPKRYHQAHHSAFPEFLRTGQGAAVGQTLELQGLRKDGMEITVALSLSAVQIKGSWHAVGILRDISKQKIAEKELYNLLDELEQVNSQLKVSNQRSNQLAVEAQAANIAKSQFLANMSHEIRTPMNGIIGMIGLLMGTDLSAEQQRYAGTVRSSSEALLSVINDILDFSKIEADKLELETIDFDLRATIEEALELLAMRAHEKNLEFICRVDPEVRTFLKGDPGRLRQILINLGSNAIKFTARGEVFLEVKLESESNEQIKIRVEVRDTGIGIPADKIGLLFSAFQQVDASTTRRFGGSGLGLAISKRLAEAMGGEIGLKSVEGQGSNFWFTAVFGIQPRRDRGSGTGLAKIAGVRILVVDDNATNRLVLSEQLASWNARHAEAASAAQALDMLHAARAQGDHFRIVITDMQMPEMDGETLGTTIKTDPGLRDTLLVMMASFGKRGDSKRLKDIGFSAYLTKPVKQSQLYDCLATVIGDTAPDAGTTEAALVTRHTISEARRLKVRILLVEDNLTNQQVALGILDKLGFHADAVNNGREAIQALETAAYDLVFMDVQMPVMDGFEATAIIRSGQTAIPNTKIPIIAMTAHAMKGDRERCLEAGMDDYISKPIAPKALTAALDKWLEHSPKLPAAVPAAPAGPLVFDRQAFMERLMNDQDLAKDITAGFLQDLPEQILMLKRHIKRGNVKAAGTQAHSIKGAAANVGGLALSVTAMALEKAAQANRLDEVSALLPELERQFQLLQEHLLENDK